MVENARPYLDLAADALRHLDSGNLVIERCVEYLTQLSMILKATSEFPMLIEWNLHSLILTQCSFRRTE